MTLTTELNVFADFKPKLPEKLSHVEIRFSGEYCTGSCSVDVLQQVKKRPKIAALDTMNYWIERTNEDLRETLQPRRHPDDQRRGDAPAFQRTQPAARGEAYLQAGPVDADHQARRIRRDDGRQARRLLRSRISAGGAARSDRRRRQLRGRLHGLSRRESGNKSDASLRRAMVYGSVMGSFTVEKFGLDRLKTLKRSEIHARARHFAKLTQFKL